MTERELDALREGLERDLRNWGDTDFESRIDELFQEIYRLRIELSILQAQLSYNIPSRGF